MKPLSVVVCHPSAVISAGLLSLMSQIRDMALSVVTVSEANLRRYINDNRPQVVIVDPLTAGNNPASYLGMEADHVPLIVGVTASCFPTAFTEKYHAVLTAYDGVDAYRELLAGCVRKQPDTDPKIELSAREKDVVIGVVKGLSNKEIASEMNVSTNTVMTHRRNIASKLQIHSVAGLTIYAIVSKLVKLEELHEQSFSR